MRSSHLDLKSMWSSGEVLPTRVRLAWWKTDARPTSCIYYCKNLFQSQDPYINSPSCLLFLSTFSYENLVFTWNSFPKLTLFFLLEYVLILYGKILLWSLLGRVTGVVHGKNPESLWGIHFTLQSPTTDSMVSKAHCDSRIPHTSGISNVDTAMFCR